MTPCPRCGKKADGIHTCTPKAAWPTWPFTRLTPEQMEALLQKMKQQRIDDVGDALL